MRIYDPEVLNRARPRGVRPEVPQPFGFQQFPSPAGFGPTPLSPVHQAQVLGLPAAWRAVNLVGNGVATMSPMECVAPDGVTIVDSPPIVSRPNATMGVFDFTHMAVAVALMRGNFLGLLADFGPDGFPRQVIPVPNDAAFAFYGTDPYGLQPGNGFLNYVVAGVRYGPLDVVHVRGFTLPGVAWGIGMVENFRRSLGATLEQQHLVADTYRRGAVPSGLLTIDLQKPTHEQVTQTQDDWIEAHGDQRKPAVLPQGWTFQPLTWSPEDAQFLQSRMFSIGEIALMAGLDPSDLGASLSNGSSAITYANIEQREIARKVDAYGPWARRFQEAWSDLIPGGNTCRFVPERLFIMDGKTAAEVHATNIDSGVETVDEARGATGKPALTAAQKAERAKTAASPPAPSPATAAKNDALNAQADDAVEPTTGDNAQ